MGDALVRSLVQLQKAEGALAQPFFQGGRELHQAEFNLPVWGCSCSSSPGAAHVPDSSADGS